MSDLSARSGLPFNSSIKESLPRNPSAIRSQCKQTNNHQKELYEGNKILVDSNKQYQTSYQSNLPEDCDNDDMKDRNCEYLCGEGSCSKGESTKNVLLRLDSVTRGEILETVNFMEFRKYNRKFKGQYRPLSRSRVVMVFLLLTFLVGMLNVNYCQKQIIFSLRWPSLILEPAWKTIQATVLLFTLIVILFVLAKTQTSQSLRWSLYLSYFYLIIVLSIFIASLIHDGLSCDLLEPQNLGISHSKHSTSESLTTIENEPRIVPLRIDASGLETIAFGSKRRLKGNRSNTNHTRQTVLHNASEMHSKKTDRGLSSNHVPLFRTVVSTSTLLLTYIGFQAAIILASLFFIYLYPRFVRSGWMIYLRSWNVASFQIRKVIVPLLPSDKIPHVSTSVATTRPEHDQFSEFSCLETKPTQSDVDRGILSTSRDRYRVQLPGYFVHVRYRRLIGRLWNLLCCIPCLGPGSRHKRRWKSNLYGHSCFYVGEVDCLGRAHGCGRWIEETYHGEILIGYWKHGRPIGPFKSREFGSGSSFCCVRIAYCGMSDDSCHLRWGVAEVECSTSGAFFRGYPRVRLDPVESFATPVTQPKEMKKEYLSFVSLPPSNEWAATSNNGSRSPYQGVTVLEESPFRDRSSCFHAAATLDELRRFGHVPNFTVTPRTSVIVGIDANRELFVSEHIPIKNYIQTTTKEDTAVVASSLDRPGSSSVSIRVIQSAQQQGVAEEAQQAGDVDLLMSSLSIGSFSFDHTTRESNPHHHRTPIPVSSTVPLLHIDGWLPVEEANQLEVVVFIPGYNCAAKYALGNFGQLISMCNLKSYIRPIVFSWPGGNYPFSFFSARRRLMKTDIPNSFCKFLLSLGDSGVHRIHIIAHSMGARVALGGLVKAFDHNFFIKLRHSRYSTGTSTIKQQPTDFGDLTTATSTIATDSHSLLEKPASENTSRFELCTCTLLNPEYELDTFVSNVFDHLRAHCPVISIYSDANDKALWWGEKFIRKRSLGRSVFGLRRDANFSLSTATEYFHKIAHPKNSLRIHDLAEMPLRHPPQSAYVKFARLTSGQQDQSDEEWTNEGDSTYLTTPITENLGAEQKGRRPLIQSKRKNLTEGNHQESRTRETGPTVLSPEQTGHHNIKVEAIDRSQQNTLVGILDDPDVQWLDVDVIDTTFVENNVHALRHTFYNVNREIIDDIADILVNKRRAHDRITRLDHREGNVWVFKVAPSYLGTLYG